VSPHIAGHSLDAKMRGSNMLAQALVRWAGEDSHSLPTDFSVMSAGERSLEGRWSSTDATDWAADFLVSQGTLAREDARIRATGSRGLLPETFDALRKTYQQPSEWSGQAIRMHGGAPELRNMAKRLGLSVVE
jgi:erythronate-4-phosphate dehydrogenase